MKAQLNLKQQDLQGFQTISEVIEHICKNENLELDSFYLMDENEQLLTATNAQIDLASIQEINVYNLRDNYLVLKKLTKQLQGEIGQNEQINFSKTTENQKLYKTLQQFCLDNEITKMKYEKYLRQFNTSNEIVNKQLRSFNTQNDNAKFQLELLLQQFIEDNKIAKMKLEQQIEQQNTNSEVVKMGFEQLLQQFNEDNDIYIKELERLILELSAEKEIAIKKLLSQPSKQINCNTQIREIQYESTIQQYKQSQDILQQDAHNQIQLLNYHLNQTQQQAQQFYMQIGWLTNEKNGLEMQMQSNEKQYKQTIYDQEEQLESVNAEFKRQLKLQKTAFEELELQNQLLIKNRNKVGTELEDLQEQLQKTQRKYKTLEEDFNKLINRQPDDTEQEQLRAQLRDEKNKNESLNVELQKIPKLQKSMEQKDYDYQKYKLFNEEEKQQLEYQVKNFEKELQTMITKYNEQSNQLQIIKIQEQQLKVQYEKLNSENSEKYQNILKASDQNQQLDMEKYQLKEDLTQKGIEITSLKQQISSLTEKLQKTQTELKEMKIQKNQAEMVIRDLEMDLAKKLKEEQRNNLQLTQEKTGLEQVMEHLKKMFKDSEQELEASLFQIQILKRQIKPVQLKTSVQNQKKFSKFIAYPDIQTQDYQFELFAIQVDNQAEFDRSLFNCLNLQQLSKFISFKSLGMQTIKKTIQPASDNTFFEGYIFQIPNPSDLANNYDPNIKTKIFLMKTIKMLKNNGYLPKSGEEGKQLLIPNLASMSILNQFITQLKKKCVKPPAFKFAQQYMIQGQTENDKYFYHVEELVDGELLKLNAFKIYDSCSPEVQFSNSLVFYSLKKLQEQAMLTNIQGIKSADGTITLYDTVLCSQQGLSSDIDLGNEEISKMKELIEKDGWRSLGDFYENIKDEFTE